MFWPFLLMNYIQINVSSQEISSKKHTGCHCNCAHMPDCVHNSACFSECAYPNKYVYMSGGGGVGKSCLTVRMLQNTYMVCLPLNMTKKTGRKRQE